MYRIMGSIRQMASSQLSTNCTQTFPAAQQTLIRATGFPALSSSIATSTAPQVQTKALTAKATQNSLTMTMESLEQFQKLIFDAMNRNARKPKRANHGKRAVCNYNRRKNRPRRA